MVDPIALYYPYIHVQDDAWLKYAALYWPKMARLRPRGYPVVDSPVASALRNDANWLMDISPPAWAAKEVARPFLDVFNTHTQVLHDRFSLDRIDPEQANPLQQLGTSTVGAENSWNTWRRWRRMGRHWTWLGRPTQQARRLAVSGLGYVHTDKIAPEVVDAAFDAGLAVFVKGWGGGTWVGMHPELASVYTCALIERIALMDRLHPVTDQELHHSAVSGWTLDRLVQVLVDEPAVRTRDTPSRPDAVDAFVYMAFETVVPADLDRVPIDKIIEVRSRFGTELDTFREYVTEQAQRLAELDDIRDLVVFQEYLRTEVQHTVTDQLTQLRERLRSLGLESVRAVVNVKSVALPPLAAMAAETIGLSPAITGPAALAACVVTAPVQWRRQRRAAIRESPVGYLFRIDRALNPARQIDRLRRIWPA